MKMCNPEKAQGEDHAVEKDQDAKKKGPQEGRKARDAAYALGDPK